MIWTTKLFMNSGQIRLLNSKNTDLKTRTISDTSETEIPYLRLTIHALCKRPRGHLYLEEEAMDTCSCNAEQ